MVEEAFQKLGMSASLKGYNYLQKAICMAVEDFDLIYVATRILYPCLAKKYCTTTARVESAIRKTIEVTWDRGDIEALDSYFGAGATLGSKKPTPIRFIATIADNFIMKERNSPVETQVSSILQAIGVPAEIKGYQYLRTAILMALSDNEIVNPLNRILYPSIAKKYCTTTARVESAIRKAIELAWDGGNVKALNSYFGDCEKITTKKFILTIADRVRDTIAN